MFAEVFACIGNFDHLMMTFNRLRWSPIADFCWVVLWHKCADWSEQFLLAIAPHAPIANCQLHEIYHTHQVHHIYHAHANCSNAALAAPCNAMQWTKNFWTEAFASILGLSFHFLIFDPCYWCFAWEPDLIS